jgi:hypothetical protein
MLYYSKIQTDRNVIVSHLMNNQSMLYHLGIHTDRISLISHQKDNKIEICYSFHTISENNNGHAVISLIKIIVYGIG